MTDMRDKIANIISDNQCGWTGFTDAHECANAILTTLPDFEAQQARIDKLELRCAVQFKQIQRHIDLSSDQHAEIAEQQARIDELTEALQHLVDLDEMDTTTTMEQEGIDKARAALKEPKE